MEKIREVVGKEYANTLGIIAYKNRIKSYKMEKRFFLFFSILWIIMSNVN